MIKLFVMDLDGCLAEPFVTPDWDAFSQIKLLQAKALHDPCIPELSICTGRPFPYVEAIAQFLNLRQPLIFECGGGLFNPVTRNILINPSYDENIAAQKQELLRYAETELIPQFPNIMQEFTKKTDIGLVSLNTEHITTLYHQAKAYVMQHYPDFEVHKTDISINIIAKLCNKGAGLEFLSRYSGIALEEMAYIGDSTGDISALTLVSRPFAPANAVAEVHAVAESLQHKETHCILEAMDKIIQVNRSFLG